ncbi:aminoglycoside phosphotransferase family protein [Umezawaea sp. Da 62-37]|uniref:aminoglycoside phosphotransferase family protein n=1 Tax=Umezawaea sp. Da 62-37 TaxID=3075927 RepID=UPI0028F738F7|nr:aminoglycoside phosphotransferase family protein [Umezawaea sp. Da 62-37]WNV86802.1 aminoglycoside phosphotransferase family protein [Umezawaea sp. Da 62-37]
MRMHDDEIDIDPPLVRALLAEHFPRWAGLPVRAVASTGTDNAMFRIGEDLAVRLPRVGWAVGGVELEQRWLPVLAPHLPVAVPEPVGLGAPACGYPWPWSVYRWLPGANPVVGALADPHGLATAVAGFVTALRAVDTAGAPAAGRGAPLAPRDGGTREAIAALTDVVDADAVTGAWEEALRAPEWTGEPVWVHGDLSPGNLLLTGDALTAVIDFGAMGLGDPACDLISAWNLLPADARDTFRGALDADDATWARGRGWALTIALLQLPYYRDTNPGLAANARHVIDQVVADHITFGCR